ncbi:hypothetical protein QBC34DRAFT_52741 [Podospora aff. communis PSN243]|uniref:Secreted protein n=1 Tax=Podospora aff. communis PSN243 TaxID=3040156 RepID=A0AAV9GU04_9PEZI|nr:hypothetical protein QBC34DRAFT_52741 [Podospora aff. communis PSN243]
MQRPRIWRPVFRGVSFSCLIAASWCVPAFAPTGNTRHPRLGRTSVSAPTGRLAGWGRFIPRLDAEVPVHKPGWHPRRRISTCHASGAPSVLFHPETLRAPHRLRQLRFHRSGRRRIAAALSSNARCL